MQPVPPHRLWLGHFGNAGDPRGLAEAGISALVDLAREITPPVVSRSLIYCRFPLVDGAGNGPWLLRTAVTTTADLVRAKIPTLVFCGAGLSRSPAVVAAALALIERIPPGESLDRLARERPMDVAPDLWQEIDAMVKSLNEGDPGPSTFDRRGELR